MKLLAVPAQTVQRGFYEAHQAYLRTSMLHWFAIVWWVVVVLRRWLGPAI